MVFLFLYNLFTIFYIFFPFSIITVYSFIFFLIFGRNYIFCHFLFLCILYFPVLLSLFYNICLLSIFVTCASEYCMPRKLCKAFSAVRFVVNALSKSTYIISYIKHRIIADFHGVAAIVYRRIMLMRAIRVAHWAKIAHVNLTTAGAMKNSTILFVASQCFIVLSNNRLHNKNM